MNTNLIRHGIVIVLVLLGWPAASVRADLEVGASISIHSDADFYQPLTSCGGWVEVDNVGRCWRPAGVAVEWQPYCEGQWVWTDCGWYWESNEPWAWACYHYGRWHHHPIHGWIWLPGVEWAPAWVSWRVGGGHIGWAPLPPARVAIVAPGFVFVETGRFHEPVRRSSVVVNNTTIINQTKVVNNIRTETRNVAGAQRKVYVNDGPGVDVVQKATRQSIKPTPIQDVARRANVPADFMRRQAERPGRDGHDRGDERNASPAAPATPAPPKAQPEQPKSQRDQLTPRPEQPKLDRERVKPQTEQPKEPVRKNVTPPDPNPVEQSAPRNLEKPNPQPEHHEVKPSPAPNRQLKRPPEKAREVPREHGEERGKDRPKGND